MAQQVIKLILSQARPGLARAPRPARSRTACDHSRSSARYSGPNRLVLLLSCAMTHHPQATESPPDLSVVTSHSSE